MIDNNQNDLARKLESVTRKQEMLLTKQDQIQSTLHGEMGVFQSPASSVLAGSVTPPFTSPTSTLRHFPPPTPFASKQPAPSQCESDVTSVLDDCDLESKLNDTFDSLSLPPVNLKPLAGQPESITPERGRCVPTAGLLQPGATVGLLQPGATTGSSQSGATAEILHPGAATGYSQLGTTAGLLQPGAATGTSHLETTAGLLQPNAATGSSQLGTTEGFLQPNAATGSSQLGTTAGLLQLGAATGSSQLGTTAGLLQPGAATGSSQLGTTAELLQLGAATGSWQLGATAGLLQPGTTTRPPQQLQNPSDIVNLPEFAVVNEANVGMFARTLASRR